MCVGMYIGMYIDMCTNMCTGMCTDMCIGVCIDMCIDMQLRKASEAKRDAHLFSQFEHSNVLAEAVGGAGKQEVRLLTMLAPESREAARVTGVHILVYAASIPLSDLNIEGPTIQFQKSCI